MCYMHAGVLEEFSLANSYTYQTLKSDGIDLDEEPDGSPQQGKGLKRYEAFRLPGPLPLGLHHGDLLALGGEREASHRGEAPG